jgi:hypothetical protein
MGLPEQRVPEAAKAKATSSLLRLHLHRSQRYAIPGGVNLKDFPSVVIWCGRFGVLISPADLSFQQQSK